MPTLKSPFTQNSVVRKFTYCQLVCHLPPPPQKNEITHYLGLFVTRDVKRSMPRTIAVVPCLATRRAEPCDSPQ